jgi:predicted metal-dependent HD superfamily phosphohydrolase
MRPIMPDLRELWSILASSYSSDESLVGRLYSELVEHYQEPHRYYHNLAHIEALLQLYFEQERAISKPDAVLFSILYHDVIYTPGRKDNEHQSAVLAGRVLMQLGVPAAINKDVQTYIEATFAHDLAPEADPDLKLFIDFDLSILAADRESYQVYLQNIRKEYSVLSIGEFTQGRKGFLRGMLSKKSIYYTESFRAKEEAARKNMQWELQMDPGIYSAL